MLTSAGGGTYVVYDQVEAIQAEIKRAFGANQLRISVDILARQYYQMSSRHISNELFGHTNIILIPELKLRPIETASKLTTPSTHFSMGSKLRVLESENKLGAMSIMFIFRNSGFTCQSRNTTSTRSWFEE